MNSDKNEDLHRKECKELNAIADNGTIHMPEKSEEKNIIPNVIVKKRFLAGEQMSQEENYLSEDVAVPVNGCFCPTENREVPCNYHKTCINQNNNLVVDKTNLRCSDEKSLCFYLKFPVKVNNNVYPEKSDVSKDGMDDYFRQYSGSQNNINHDPKYVCNGFSDRITPSSCEVDTVNDSQPYPDHINALNGDDEDEHNGCIYTYKGDNYEANLSHLLETCFSCGLPTTKQPIGTVQRGTVSIQRLLNGSPHQNPKPPSNLYSPDMDFLEMDFDPGSAGDGGDSDCEDNNVLNVTPKLTEENTLENFIKQDHNLDKKANNIPTEIRSLMCRRCEMCIYNDQKVNNTSSDLAMQKSNCDEPSVQLQLPSAPSKLPLDDRPNDQRNLSNDLMRGRDEDTSQRNDLETVNSIQENDLNGHEEEFSDGGDEADDEGGDESTSDHPTSDPRRVSVSSLFLPSPSEFQSTMMASNANNFHDRLSPSPSKSSKHIRFSCEASESNSLCNCLLSSTKTNSDAVTESDGTRDSNIVSKTMNNNLGSISAPEVSPTKEYSPIERISRSLSFHNQLSSPKYENVCFSHPYKDNLVATKYNSSSDHQCVCTIGHSSCKVSQHPQMANLEACVDRLSQRERSVFNIVSNSFSPQNTSRAPLTNSVEGSSECKVSNSLSCAGSEADSVSCNDEAPYFYDDFDQDELDSDLMDVHSKLLRHKSHDLSEDPNTAKESTIEDHVKNGLKTHTAEKVMIWTERQATFRQVSQVGTSACGATAVINALLALDEPRPVKDVILAIKTRLRAEESPLVDYLLSRSNAGTTHSDLLRGIQEISDGAVTGRFFHMFPKRAFQLTRWLTHWIKKGGVPVATLNLQVGVSMGQTIPDAWHHQMVFGVGPLGIYLTNPLECVTDSLLADQLCSDSVLLVRRSDIDERWDQKDQLIHLSLQSDPRWNEMNVLGQVVCVLKELAAPEMLQGRRHLTTHVAIPASYQSGVTIFIRSDNPCKTELFESPELPLLDE